jgi:hypothetical protein
MNLRHAAALLLMVLAGTSPGVAFPDGTCDAKLVGNSYQCTVVFETLGESAFSRENCVEFVSGGLSFNFDLVGVGDFLSGDYGCQCEVTSSPSSIVKKAERGHLPFAFHLSADAFECVGDTVNLTQLHGKIDSDKLYGQGSEADGSTLVFVCRKRSTACE